VVGHLSFDVWLTLLRSNQTFKSLRNHLMIEMFEISQPVTAVDEVFRRMDRIFTKVNEIAGMFQKHNFKILNSKQPCCFGNTRHN
jgi:hypothetical protein